MKLTRADRKILEILQQDSSVTNVELAERVGLSPSPCLRRVKQLEASGLIAGYVALLDRRKARLDLLAYVEVQVDRHSETAADAFAEAVRRGVKLTVVRDWLGTCMPAAGVGCAIERTMLQQLARDNQGQPDAVSDGPFSVESLTEDYELGLRIHALGGRSRFMRVRGEDGSLIATRALFPSRLDEAVRQKARWVHGIALQGWDRLG